MLIGRKKEADFLRQVVASSKAELIALYGRRRVGKTYLVRSLFVKEKTYFELMGQKNATLAQQLKNFNVAFCSLYLKGMLLEPPKSWNEAFERLTNQIDKKKTVLFFDELPWLSSRKSGFIEALDYYWNTRWSQNPHIKLIVCGSAASWMIDEIINAKGGLHNRLTGSILLSPFNLQETRDYLHAQKIRLHDQHILEIYMAVGGIPYYLNFVEKNQSATEVIDHVYFSENAPLQDEFQRLFESLYDNAQNYMDVIRALAAAPYGLTRSQLIKETKMTSGGRLQKRLIELETCGFIQTIVREGAYYAWAGYAFETVCFIHVGWIQKVLHLEGNLKSISSWWSVGNKEKPGAKIDLLFERRDQAITLCEIKYSMEPFVINRETAVNLQKKMTLFGEQYPKHQLFWALISPYGMKSNTWSEDLINGVVVLKDLF